jgi:hypothetical protein
VSAGSLLKLIETTKSVDKEDVKKLLVKHMTLGGLNKTITNTDVVITNIGHFEGKVKIHEEFRRYASLFAKDARSIVHDLDVEISPYFDYFTCNSIRFPITITVEYNSNRTYWLIVAKTYISELSPEMSSRSYLDPLLKLFVSVGKIHRKNIKIIYGERGTV